MDNQPNQMPPQQNAPMQEPMSPMQKKKGHSAVVLIIILILVIIAVALFGKSRMIDDSIDDNTVGTTNTQANSSGSSDEDLNSIEAELEATNIDGTSDGL